MGKKNEYFKPPSLTQHFQPPEGFVGCFGYMCGYSADAAFLEDACERFTGQTTAQRSYTGQISLALMLDPGNEYISLIEVPGVLHLGIKDIKQKPFVLLHAKVALLAFHRASQADHWILRLIVSTGNWTRDTLENNLDLVWTIDLSHDQIDEIEEECSQARADIKAAWDMLNWLQSKFDTRLLSGFSRSLGSNGNILFSTYITQLIAKSERAQPRFFDSRERSLLQQLPRMVTRVAPDSPRNYIAMGSGFFEGAENKDTVPSVLKAIVTALQGTKNGKRLLTACPDKDVYVNPLGCQSIASSLEALEENGFTIRQAGQPDYFGSAVRRTLHAKFIFSANLRGNSETCNSGWLYLGSGNLTTPGFARPMSQTGGNLEAGVVLAVRPLHLTKRRNVPPEDLLWNLLPMQWEQDVNDLPEPICSGSEMLEREVQFLAAPVPYLTWLPDTGFGWLQAPEGVTATYQILDDSGHAIDQRESGLFKWIGDRPRMVLVSWIDGDGAQTRKTRVPIQDEFGRFAATALSKLDLDEAWWQLANFPMPPNDEELVNGNDQENFSCFRHETATTEVSATAVYPVRQMMELIENIAAKQTQISRSDWFSWCARLEQCMIRAADSIALKAFLDLQINPIAPLWHPPFRPAFAETPDNPEGQEYERVLRRIETEWNVADLDNWEKQNEAEVSRMERSLREAESIR